MIRWLPLGAFLILACIPVASGCQPDPATERAETTKATETPTEVTTRPAQVGATVDREFAAILTEVVTKDGLVHYDRLGERPRRERLDAVVAGYAKASKPADRDARMALWINAYNANVLRMAEAAQRSTQFVNVVTEDGFFDKTPITVAGEVITLNTLENERIRPLGDARIHAALVCAAISCPPLRNEPFAADRLSAQLDDQCRRWINDPTKNGVDGETLAVSRIMEWYGDDFKGPKVGGIAAFAKSYAAPGTALARFLAANPTPAVTFRRYDWTLNRAPTSKKDMQTMTPDRAKPTAQVPMEITAKDAHASLSGDETIVLLDCRRDDEWAAGRIDGARHIPMDQILERIGELDDARETTVVVYCHHGRRSMMVTKALREQGFDRAVSMQGGIDAWSVEIDSSIPRY